MKTDTKLALALIWQLFTLVNFVYLVGCLFSWTPPTLHGFITAAGVVFLILATLTLHELHKRNTRRKMDAAAKLRYPKTETEKRK